MPDEVTRDSIKQEAKEMAVQLAKSVAEGVGDALTGALGVRGLEKAFADLGQRLGHTLTRSLSESIEKEPAPRMVGRVSPVEYGRELEHFHEQLEKMVIQLQNTIDLLREAGITIVDAGELRRIEQVAAAILDRQGITPETAKDFVRIVKQVQDTLSKMSETTEDFQVDMGSVFSRYHKVLEDTRVSLDTQKGLIQDVQKYMISEETPIAEKIRRFDVIGLDQAKVKEFLALIDQAREGETGKVVKSLDEVNKKLEGAVITPEEIQETMDEPVRSSGKSFSKTFMESPGKFTIGSDVRRGLLDALFGGLGLGPLTENLKLPERIEAMWGLGVSRAKEGMGHLFGRGGTETTAGGPPEIVGADSAAINELKSLKEESKKGTDRVVKAIESQGDGKDITDAGHRANIRSILDRVHKKPGEMVPEIEEAAEIASSEKMIGKIGPRYSGWITKMFPGLSSMLGAGTMGIIGPIIVGVGTIVAGLLAFYLGKKLDEGLDETNKQIDQINSGLPPGPEFKGKPKRGTGSGWSEVISEGLFPMTKFEEVGRKGGMWTAVSDRNDTWSYGSLGFNTKGLLPGFLESTKYGKEFEGMTPGTKEFTQHWKEYFRADPKEAEAAEHAMESYAYKTEYLPVVKYAHKMGLNVQDPGMQKFLADQSNQTSYAGNVKIIDEFVRQFPEFKMFPAVGQIRRLGEVRATFLEDIQPGLGARATRVAEQAAAESERKQSGTATPRSITPSTVTSQTKGLEGPLLGTPTPVGSPVETITTLSPPKAPEPVPQPPPSITITPPVSMVEKRKSIDDFGIALFNRNICR